MSKNMVPSSSRIAMDAKTKRKYQVFKKYSMSGMWSDGLTGLRYDLVKVYI